MTQQDALRMSLQDISDLAHRTRSNYTKHDLHELIDMSGVKARLTLSDSQSALAEQDDEAVAYWLYEITLGEGVYQGCTGDDAETVISQVASSFESSGKPFKTYTRPAPKTYTENDIDVAIGVVEWDKLNLFETAEIVKQIVMRFVGSQVKVEPKWIPVRDRLPEIDSDVLILSADHDWVILGEYSGEFYRYSEASGTERVRNVRFWSPIPILPKFLQEPIDKMTGGGE